MKLLVLLLVTASLALSPTAVLAPGDGGAAAVIAAQGKGAPIQPAGTQNGTVAFLLTGSAKVYHVDGGPQVGGSVFKHTLKTADAILCSQHDESVAFDCNPGKLPLSDVSPGVYLFVDTYYQFRLANNPNGDDAATLTGLMDSKGGFQMAGDFVWSAPADGDVHTTHIFLTGKCKLEKGTLNVTKVSGKFQAVSTDMQHYATGSFKSELLGE